MKSWQRSIQRRSPVSHSKTLRRFVSLMLITEVLIADFKGEEKMQVAEAMAEAWEGHTKRCSICAAVACELM